VRRLLIALASLAATLVLIEGLARLRQYLRYGTTVKTLYHLVEDPVSGLRIPGPNETIGAIHVNSLGFRGAEIERPKPAQRVRVAFLGGSTTFCGEASSLETTWPEQVVQGLRAAASDLEFVCVNGGGPGYSTAELLPNLEFRVAPLEPDVLVLYEATNDLTVDSRRLAIAQGLYEREDEDDWLGDHWLTWFLIEKNVKHWRRTSEHAGPSLSFVPSELSAPFRERLRALVTRAQGVAPVVCLVTFSTQIRRDQSSETQHRAADSAQYYMPFLDVAGLLDGYEEYNRVIREVAGETGAILVQGESAIPGDGRHFSDSVHFLDPGLRLQAERVLAGLTQAPAYQELVRKRRAELGR